MDLDKAALRQQFTQLRRQLGDEVCHSVGRQVADLLVQLPEYAGSRHIALYAACHSEVELRDFFDRCIQDGKACYFPRVTGDDLSFHQAAAWSELSLGAYGILAPLAQAPVLDPGRCELIIVPGVAFDRHGVRLGRGKGFYDRYLPKVGGRRVGVGFDCCVVETLPHEPHDARIHVLVTESGVLRFQGGV